MRIAGVLYMKESFILELFNLIPLSKCVINGNSSKCKNVYKLIKKYKDWIDSSSKKDLPPDFYSDKYKIMMEIMSINDVEYNDDNTIKNFASLIQKYDPGYKAPFILTNKKQWKGCLIVFIVILFLGWLFKLLGI